MRTVMMSWRNEDRSAEPSRGYEADPWLSELKQLQREAELARRLGSKDQEGK
jgi:hypothetical protein